MKKKKREAPLDPAPAEFVAWWYPFEFQEKSHASVGGHPDAARLWARPEAEGGFTRRHSGIPADIAWQTDRYRQEFYTWRSIGSPEPAEPFVSLAAPLERQKEFWTSLKEILKTGVHTMPKPLPHDYDPPSVHSKI